MIAIAISPVSMIGSNLAQRFLSVGGVPVTINNEYISIQSGNLVLVDDNFSPITYNSVPVWVEPWLQ